MTSVSKTIKCKIVGLTKYKKEIIEQEWLKYQFWIQSGIDLGVHSIYKTQFDWYRDKRKQPKEIDYSMSVSNQRVKIVKNTNKLSNCWFNFPTKQKYGGIWLPIRPHQDISDDEKFSETKILKKGDDFFVYLTIKKEIEPKKEYDDILAIDLGVRNIASVVQMSTMRPKFYGKELRAVRGHYFYLRKKVGEKKIRGFIKWTSNDNEKRVVNDMLHKISREIVNQAKDTNSLIVLGDLKGLKNSNVKKSKGRKFNRKIMNFPYFKLSKMIEYKAGFEGIKVLKVSESYTSQICHSCGEIGIRKAGLFKCSCGLRDNSDRNGAINIGKRALEYISNAGVSLNIPRTEATSPYNDLRNYPIKG